ncbi:ATP-grasp domain-containing protein [Virgibacillus halophilus]|uniref:ATP-grasp domain-containing protein n=1 Tax=Tigheibacillus halophilus TaxID=361280 RepID=A0ABU5C2U2_9BACI|nr:ATP-grasp domain-containing protein [Virgibacillus halophilus]
MQRKKTAEIITRAENMPSLLVEEAINIAKEFYVSITADPVTGNIMMMGSAEGGIDIEEVAKTMPEKIIRSYIDINQGLMPFQARAFFI